MILSLPDISYYGPWIALAGVIVAAIAVVLKFKKRKPKIVLTCTSKFWHLRQATSIVTDIYVTLLMQNKGEAATTINTPVLNIVYKGQPYGPIYGELDNILVEPGGGPAKQFQFHLARSAVVIDSPIERATIHVNTTYGKSMSLQITDIGQQ